jgi:hypothetical protein
MATTGLTGLGTKKRVRRLPIIPIFSWLFLILAAGLFLLELVRFSQEADRLATEVTVAGVEVGGLSPSEAVARWEEAFAEPITLWYGTSPILLDPAQVDFRTNQASMLAAARTASTAENSFWGRFIGYLTGQTRTQTVNIELSADYQERLLENLLRDIAARYDRIPGTADVDVQTLTVRSGGTGTTLDIDQAMRLVDAALRSPNEREVILPVAGSDANRPNINALRDLIIAYLDSEGFIYDGQTTLASVFIMDLETGDEVNILSDVAVSAASTVKIGIMIDYFRSQLFAPDRDAAYLLTQSLLCSNNSSSNLIMQSLIGNGDLPTGIASVTNTMQYLGARNSYIAAPFILGVSGEQFFNIPAPTTAPNSDYNTGHDQFNQTTTEDLGTLLSLIYDCAYYGSGLMAAYPNGEFTQLECQQMLSLLAANDLERLLQGGLPDDAVIAHKNGWLQNVHGDAGIVFPPSGRDYVIAVYVWQAGEFFSFEEAWPLIEGISRAAWNYFEPNQPLITPRTDLPPTAADCIDFSPPYEQVDLNNINAWRGLDTPFQFPR